jgi:hypothetical protein
MSSLIVRIMDDFPWLKLPDDGLPFYASVVVASLLTLFILFRFSYDSEAAVDYTVASPSQIHPDWKGEILETPSIKVGSDSLRDETVLMQDVRSLNLRQFSAIARRPDSFLALSIRQPPMELTA